MRLQHVLVTGASGFLGLNLVAALRKKQIAVRVLIRPTCSQQSRSILAQLGVETANGDVIDPRSLPPALDGIDTIFHLAGKLLIAGVPNTVYQQVHIEGTRNILTACMQAPQLQRIIHCSTTGVLGVTGQQQPDESAILNPGNIYEYTKAIGEQLALAAGTYLPVVIARPALVYGPGDLHLLGWFRAIQRGLYHIIGDGRSLLHPIYIDDLIDGLLRCATEPTALGRTYHLVGSVPVAIADLARTIAATLGKRLPAIHIPLGFAHTIAALFEAIPGIPAARLPLTRSRVAFMTQNRAYSGARATTELGFIPQVALTEGLFRTVAWYRSKGLL